MAGVSIDEGNKAVELMKESMSLEIGSFGGIINFSDEERMDFIKKKKELVFSMDGVGTKSSFMLSYSHLLGMSIEQAYYALGVDLINHCINDILVEGCYNPKGFLDYFANASTKAEHVNAYVQGINSVCKNMNEITWWRNGCNAFVYKTGKHICEMVGTIVGIRDGSEFSNPLGKKLHQKVIIL